MASVSFKLQNIASLISITLPFFIILFSLMLTIFDFNIKGIIFIFFCLCVVGLNFALSNTFPEELNDLEKEGRTDTLCNLFNKTDSAVHQIPIGVSILAFSFCYTLSPMIKYTTFNPLFVLLFALYLVMDLYTYVIDMKCTNLKYYGFGLFSGLFWGVVAFYAMDAIDNKLLYFNSPSNSIVCSKPKQQNFKCQVYKNGVLLA